MKEEIVVEAGSGNVYADIGIEDAGEMLVKAQLVTTIHKLLKERGLSQTQAAEIIGLPQPKLSLMLRGHFRGISEAKMMDCITRLGQDVQIVIGPALNSGQIGRVEVVHA